MVFLRLRKAPATRRQGLLGRPLRLDRRHQDHGNRVLATVPGAEAATLDALADSGDGEALSPNRAPAASPVPWSLVGERLAPVAGALSSAARPWWPPPEPSGWVPRRAGERGALDAGALTGPAARRPSAESPPGRPRQVAAALGHRARGPARRAGRDLARSSPRSTPTTPPSEAATDGSPSTASGPCAARGRRRGQRSRRPGRVPGRARGRAFVVSLEQRALRRHRPRRRRAPRRGAAGEAGHLPRLGGPPAPSRRRCCARRSPSPTPACWR